MLEEVFEFHNWKVQIKRKFFRHGMTLTIDQNLKIQITTGLSSPTHDIARFLSTKKRWLEKHFQKIQASQNLHTILRQKQVFQPGGKFSYLGQELQFQQVFTPLHKYFISISEPYLNLHIPIEKKDQPRPSDQWIQAEVQKVFYKHSKKYLTEKIYFWSEQTQLFPKSLSFKKQRSRWGSCSARSRISLNLKLIVFSPEVIDYVLVHELSHLKHMNHSAQFWSLVSQFLPDHKKLSKKLQTEHWKTSFL